MFKDNIFQLLNQLEYKEKQSFRRYSSTADDIKLKIELIDSSAAENTAENGFDELKKLEEHVQNGIKGSYRRCLKGTLNPLILNSTGSSSGYLNSPDTP